MNDEVARYQAVIQQYLGPIHIDYRRIPVDIRLVGQFVTSWQINFTVVMSDLLGDILFEA